jgi:hypothetical protein
MGHKHWHTGNMCKWPVSLLLSAFETFEQLIKINILLLLRVHAVHIQGRKFNSE